jgi:hypothetical protein
VVWTAMLMFINVLHKVLFLTLFSSNLCITFKTKLY